MMFIAKQFRTIYFWVMMFFGLMLILFQLSEIGLQNAITLYRINNLSEKVNPDNNRRIETLSRRLISYNPDSRFGYRLLGYGLVGQGKVDEAILVWCNVNDISVELFQMGQQARRSARYQDATLWYKVVEAVSPGKIKEYEIQWPLYYYKSLEEDIPSIDALLKGSVPAISSNYPSCQ